MRDEDWFTRVYCAALYLLPDSEKYSARSWQGPFDHGNRIFISARDFVIGSFQTVSPSFSNQANLDFLEAVRDVDHWSFRNGFTTSVKLKRHSEASSRQDSFSQPLNIEDDLRIDKE